MRVAIETPDSTCYLASGECLAAFIIMLDVVTGQGITRSSLPELLDDADKWQSWVGHSYPQPDDPDVTTAIRLLQTELANGVAPLHRFAYAKPFNGGRLVAPEGRLAGSSWYAHSMSRHSRCYQDGQGTYDPRQTLPVPGLFRPTPAGG